MVDERVFGARRFDVIAAADVLCYFGDVGPLFQAFASVLEKTGGLVCFTTELDDEADGVAPGVPNASGARYAHGVAYVEAAARAVGWALASKAPFSPRKEGGLPVAGMLWAFRPSPEVTSQC